MLEEELRQQGRVTFFVPLSGVRRPDEVGSRILDELTARGLRGSTSGRIVQSSAGAPRVSDVVEVLREAGTNFRRPVLILDGLDEATDTVGTVSVVDELSRALIGWQSSSVRAQTWLSSALIASQFLRSVH